SGAGVSLREARALDQPCCREFGSSSSREPRYPYVVSDHTPDPREYRVDVVVDDDRIGEKRPGTPGVVVRGVEHHALATTELENRSACLGRGHSRAGVDSENIRQLRVTDRHGHPVAA